MKKNEIFIHYNINVRKGGKNIPIKINDSKNTSYEIIEQIGSGGASFILKVRRESDQHEFALKLLKNKPKPEKRKRKKEKKKEKFLKEEIEYIRELEDTGFFIKIYGEGEIDGYEYYIMDLADGDLTSFICNLDSSSETNIIGYITDLAKSLKLIHEKDYVHRDIKPQNILLVAGSLQISDFGMFTKVNEDCRIIGPKYWPSPELLTLCDDNEHCSSKQTDIFLLGCIFFFLYTQKYPVGNINIDEISDKMKMKPIIERMLSYKKENRIKDGVELYQEIMNTFPK